MRVTYLQCIITDVMGKMASVWLVPNAFVVILIRPFGDLILLRAGLQLKSREEGHKRLESMSQGRSRAITFPKERQPLERSWWFCLLAVKGFNDTRLSITETVAGTCLWELTGRRLVLFQSISKACTCRTLTG